MTLSKERPCPFRGKAKGRLSSSPIVNRYIHSAEFTHKAIPKSKDENASLPPPPLHCPPNPNRDTSLCYNVTRVTTPLSLSLPNSRRERRISRYNLLYARTQKEFLTSPVTSHETTIHADKFSLPIIDYYRKKSNVNLENFSRKRKKRCQEHKDNERRVYICIYIHQLLIIIEKKVT